MPKVTYHIIEHDGGWAYRVGDVISETFPSHDLARRAAERAAAEQQVGGETRTFPGRIRRAAGMSRRRRAATGRKPTSRRGSGPARNSLAARPLSALPRAGFPASDTALAPAFAGAETLGVRFAGLCAGPLLER